MTKTNGANTTNNNSNPYKVVGLIASIFTVLAIFIGAVMWISVSMANNTVNIGAVQAVLQRHESRISSNAEDNSKVIGQHSQLISLIEQQQKSIDVLNEFMTQGGRFTAEDGRALHADLEKVKTQLLHYEVLETELTWIKKSIEELERNIRQSFNGLDRKLEIVSEKQDKVYEAHGGQFGHGAVPFDFKIDKKR